MTTQAGNDTAPAQNASQRTYLVRPGVNTYHEHHGGHRAVCGAMLKDMSIVRERPAGRLCERCVARRVYWSKMAERMRAR